MVKLNTEKYETKRFIRGINMNLAAAGVEPAIFGQLQIPDCRYPEQAPEIRRGLRHSRTPELSAPRLAEHAFRNAG